MAKSKKDAKAISQQKRHRRQWITFLRMCRYGVNNFTRNAWLTIAATAVMTITLLVIFVSVLSQHVMANTLETIRDRITMSIYLKNDADEQSVKKVVSEIEKLNSVVAVSVQSPDAARQAFIESNKSDSDTLDAVKEATNKFPWTLSVKVKDVNNTSELATIVKDNTVVKDAVDPDRPPSFAGSRRVAIEKIASAADFAQKGGIILSVIFVAISTLIIFNTIRMAIFNRREEIQMMKLIGAERSFIRGPFIVEAVVYGFFAAILASGIGYGIFILAAPALSSADIAVTATQTGLTIYAGFILLGMIIIGAIIGMISSLMATHRYLRTQ